jgi:hypothetical protein
MSGLMEMQNKAMNNECLLQNSLLKQIKILID